MAYRILFGLLVVAMLLGGSGSAQGQPAAPAGSPTYLTAVEAAQPAALEAFAQTALPAYAYLPGSQGDYLLVGADETGLARLAAAGLEARPLDDMSGASYFLGYPAPNRPVPSLPAGARLLLDDGNQMVVRIDPAAAEQWAINLLGIQALPLRSIPLPSSQTAEWDPQLVDPDPIIQGMIDQVTSDTVEDYDGGLSGEHEVTIGGDPYTILTRYTYSGTPIQKATQYVGEHLDGLGIPVEYHVWQAPSYPNVIGEISGLTNPEEIYIISAHLDDTSQTPTTYAPGADDNGSGSTAVMIAAEIFSQFDWDCTLRFIYFTGEEQGLNGSEAYALRSYQLGENIAGVLNLDMIAWNSPASARTIELHARTNVAGSVPLAQLFADVVDAYNIDLVPQIVTPGSGASDQASFWTYGIAAILGIEDFQDFNPYYHSTNDQLENMDLGYFTDYVKASVGTFAHMTGCMAGEVDTGTLSGEVTDAASNAPIADALIDLDGVGGWQGSATTNAAGVYTATLPADIYTVTASAAGYLTQTVTAVEVLSGTLTTQDFALSQPAAEDGWLEGTVTEDGNDEPIVGAQIQIELPGGGQEFATADAMGYYTITLPAGTYTVTATAEGFIAETVTDVEVLEGAGTTLDFALLAVEEPMYPLYLPVAILQE